MQKKFICLVFLAVFSKLFVLAQQGNFALALKVKGCHNGYLKLISLLPNKDNLNKKYYLKSNGKVIIAGKIDYPEMVHLVLNDSLHTDDFFISPGKQNLVLDAASRMKFYNSVLSLVSPINNEYRNGYLKRVGPFYDSLDNWYGMGDSLRSVYQGNYTESALMDLNQRFLIITRQMDSVKKNYFLQNPSSYVTLWMLYYSSSAIVNLELVSDCFKSLDANLIKTVLGQHLNRQLKAQKAFLTGNIFPDLVLKDSAENKIYLGQISKKNYTLIDFWFSHCGPCIGQFSEIKRIYNKYRDSGFEVISISTDMVKDKNNWKGIMMERALNWPQYWDVNAIQANQLYIHDFPTNFLLDGNGKIIDKDITLEALEEFLIRHASTTSTAGN